MRPITAALLLAVATAAGAAWLVKRAVPAPVAAPEPTYELDAASANCGTTEPELRFVAGANEREASASPQARAPEPPGIEDAGPAPVGADFTWKYGRNSRAELIERLNLLESTVQLASDRAFEERWKAPEGIEAHEIAANDARGVDEIAASHVHEGELCATRLVFANENVLTLQARPQAVNVVCLPRAGYAELYEQVGERDWLREFIQGRPPEDP